MNLSELVRSERERVGISRSELARRSGVTPSVITRLEEGEVTGRGETIARITNALGIPADRVFRVLLGEDTEIAPPPRPNVIDQVDELLRRVTALEGGRKSNAEPSVRARSSFRGVRDMVPA